MAFLPDDDTAENVEECLRLYEELYGKLTVLIAEYGYNAQCISLYLMDDAAGYGAGSSVIDGPVPYESISCTGQVVLD